MGSRGRSKCSACAHGWRPPSLPARRQPAVRGGRGAPVSSSGFWVGGIRRCSTQRMELLCSHAGGSPSRSRRGWWPSTAAEGRTRPMTSSWPPFLPASPGTRCTTTTSTTPRACCSTRWFSCSGRPTSPQSGSRCPMPPARRDCQRQQMRIWAEGGLACFSPPLPPQPWTAGGHQEQDGRHHLRHPGEPRVRGHDRRHRRRRTRRYHQAVE